jgi:hypothetical protein
VPNPVLTEWALGMTGPDDKLLERLMAKDALTKAEKRRLRAMLPLGKLEQLIDQHSKNKNDRATAKQLYKIQNILYPNRKKPPKRFRVQPIVKGNIVDQVVSSGLPGLGKRRK